MGARAARRAGSARELREPCRAAVKGPEVHGGQPVRVRAAVAVPGEAVPLQLLRRHAGHGRGHLDVPDDQARVGHHLARGPALGQPERGRLCRHARRRDPRAAGRARGGGGQGVQGPRAGERGVQDAPLRAGRGHPQHAQGPGPVRPAQGAEGVQVALP